MAPTFLAEPMIQWSPGGWLITWFSDVPEGSLEVGADASSLSRVQSQVTRLARMSEGQGNHVQPRDVFRHRVGVDHLTDDVVWHRATVCAGDRSVTSPLVCSRKPASAGGLVLLTSDHQAMPLTAFATTMMGRIPGEPLQAVFYAGDCVNVPDRASEWFDLPAGNSFFQCLEGTATFRGADGRLWPGAPIAQHCPIFTCVGNHEVMGRVAGRGLDHAFNEPVPREVAVREFERLQGRPPSSAADQRWVEDNSWSIRTYQEVFSLDGTPGWYATRVGNVFLISLFATRAWRPMEATADPVNRATNSRYHDAAGTQDAPLERGHGSFPFVPIGKGSEQYRWLRQQLASPERSACRWTVVMMHEGPFSTGDNVMPPWSVPREVPDLDAEGHRVGTQYHYEQERNPLLKDLVPLFDAAHVDLVLSGHNHIWNRFTTPAGVHYLETSNVGNTYGSTEVGLVRELPPEPWVSSDYLDNGSPGSLAPVMGAVAADDVSVLSLLDTHSGRVDTWTCTAGGVLRAMDNFQLLGDRQSPGADSEPPV